MVTKTNTVKRKPVVKKPVKPVVKKTVKPVVKKTVKKMKGGMGMDVDGNSDDEEKDFVELRKLLQAKKQEDNMMDSFKKMDIRKKDQDSYSISKKTKPKSNVFFDKLMDETWEISETMKRDNELAKLFSKSRIQ